MINFETEKGQMSVFDFGSFQTKMPSRDKYLIDMLFGAFYESLNYDTSRFLALIRLSIIPDSERFVKNMIKF